VFLHEEWNYILIETYVVVIFQTLK